ncbi:D-sedoheptulose 7-phosphate isomerase [candidate division NPL-UPA2 bacterium]|nr:D-sedoheptulose 7-phosphate isomerase [candidate division NPL-UPA2 bacterium]
MKDKIIAGLKESIQVKEAILKGQVEVIAAVAESVTKAVREGGKIILFGNGGSAADAQHLAAELVGRFKRERRAVAAIALSTNTSILTSIGNDYSFKDIFRRQIEALAAPRDIVIGISTSGRAGNVIEAVKAAKGKGLFTVGFTGGDGGELAKLADLAFIVPSSDTARIQEAHITAGHLVCQLVEELL